MEIQFNPDQVVPNKTDHDRVKGMNTYFWRGGSI